MTKDFGPVFLLLSIVTNLRQHFRRVHKVLWQSLLNIQDQFIRTKEVVEQKFFQKNAICSMKKLACFFSFYRVWQTWGNILLDCTMWSANHCASYKIISLGPQMLWKTQTFEKKGKHSSGKIFWPNFSHTIEHDKRPKQLIGVQKIIWKLLWKLWDHFFTT